MPKFNVSNQSQVPSRHQVEIQLPQGCTRHRTVGFYVVGHTDEIKNNLHPVLIKDVWTPKHDYIPCDIVALDNTE